jgi:hypothetical protein
MHKRVILLAKAETKNEAFSVAKEFLERYQDQVWDWYQIGGRWQGCLAPMRDAFQVEANKLLPPGEHGFVSQNQVDAKQEELQKAWEDLKGIGPNPYSDHYHTPEGGGHYDVLPLKDCIGTVSSWAQTIEDAKQAELEAKRWLVIGGNKHRVTGEPLDDYNMYGFSLGIADRLYQQDFCFDCNVFNIADGNYSIPAEIDAYFAVVVDMHN